MAKDLVETTSRWKAMMQNADTGPLNIAKEVVAVIDGWEEYQESQGDLSAQAWLETKVFRPGLGVGFWRIRAQAVVSLGEAVRRNLHHEAAVWVYRSVPDDQRAELLPLAYRESKRIHSAVPLAVMQRLYREMAGTKPPRKSRACKECERLRGLLEAAGVDWRRKKN